MRLTHDPLPLPQHERHARMLARAAALAAPQDDRPALPQWNGDWTGGRAIDDPNAGDDTPTVDADPMAYWHRLADGLDPFSFTGDPTTEQQHAAVVLWCIRQAANGRRFGAKPRAGKKHKDVRPTTPALRNVPARGTSTKASAIDVARNRQHDIEAAHDAIGRALLVPDRDPTVPFAALAGAFARTYGVRLAQHRTDRAFARLDVDELPEPAAPETCANVARVALASIAERLTPEQRDDWNRAMACWRARQTAREDHERETLAARAAGVEIMRAPDGMCRAASLISPPMQRSDSALRTMRRLARRALPAGI